MPWPARKLRSHDASLVVDADILRYTKLIEFSTAWRLKASSYFLGTAFNDKVLSIPGHSVAPEISVRQSGGTSVEPYYQPNFAVLWD